MAECQDTFSSGSVEEEGLSFVGSSVSIVKIAFCCVSWVGLFINPSYQC